jgi:iron-sulfur cluster assembly protein
MPTLRMMPTIVTMTGNAVRRVRSLMDANPKALGLRVGVKKGGCAGMEYTMAVAEEKGPHDEVVEQDGAVVLIEPTAIMYLLGTEMDYQTDKLASQFVFNNPNQTSACGCGESVNLTPSADAKALAQGE